MTKKKKESQTTEEKARDVGRSYLRPTTEKKKGGLKRKKKGDGGDGRNSLGSAIVPLITLEKGGAKTKGKKGGTPVSEKFQGEKTFFPRLQKKSIFPEVRESWEEKKAWDGLAQNQSANWPTKNPSISQEEKNAFRGKGEDAGPKEEGTRREEKWTGPGGREAVASTIKKREKLL